MAIRWAEFDGGFMGIMGCGLTIVIPRVTEGPFTGAYRVRFANVENEIQEWNADTAKQKGLHLAFRVMADCMCDLERALEEHGIESKIRANVSQGTSQGSGGTQPGSVHGYNDSNPERKPVQPASVPVPLGHRQAHTRKSGKKD